MDEMTVKLLMHQELVLLLVQVPLARELPIRRPQQQVSAIRILLCVQCLWCAHDTREFVTKSTCFDFCEIKMLFIQLCICYVIIIYSYS